MKKKLFKFANQRLQVQWNEAVATEPVEILIYDAIGKDPWDGKGMSASDFRNALAQVPRDRDLNLRVNSKGGDVHEGMAMMNALNEWPNNVIATIDGVAASTASWMILAADEVRSYKNSQVFIHDAIACGYGNAEDLRNTADKLDTTSNQIAGMYADKTGESVEDMRQMMKDETLMTGEEAEDLGLVDTIIDGVAARNFASDELVKMRNTLSKFYNNSAPKAGDNKNQKESNIMNKAAMIALLNKWGVTVPENATDDQLVKLVEAGKPIENKLPENKPPAVDPEILKLQNQVKDLTELNNNSKKIRITNEVKALVANDQLPAALEAKAIARAMGDEEYLNELKSLPSRPPGAAPLSASRVECTGDSLNDVQNFMLDNGPRFMQNFIGIKAQNEVGPLVCRDIRDRALILRNTFQKHRKMLTEMFNTNTIDATMQRVVILQEMLEEFAVNLLPLTAFSTVFSNVPLEGTDEVSVPFYDLAADAGNSWVAGTGYNTMGDTALAMRKVAVGGSGVNSGANAAANTAKDRKWVGLEFTSYEMNRQPYVNWQKHAGQKANRLGVLIFTDIVSRVITAGNFGQTVKAVPAAAFTGDDIADLWENATGRQWPQAGRSLTLAHTYKTPLLKDPTFKSALASGDTETLRKAQISQAYGFENINTVPNLTTFSPAGENLVGWINWLYAVLVATAPIMPTPEVRALMTRYDVVSDPKTGITFEYRRFGNVTLDKTQETIECSYGAAKGVASALARLTSQ
jgi:ATP-dependent protease ClpP protease subunit